MRDFVLCKLNKEARKQFKIRILILLNDGGSQIKAEK